MNTARTDLQASFKAMKVDRGLLDMKFSLGEVTESTVEDVCAVINRVIKDVDDGKAKNVDKWNDSHRV
jgi:hypothetical protein